MVPRERGDPPRACRLRATPVPPAPRSSSRLSSISSPRVLGRTKAGKGMLWAQSRSPLLVLFRNFARGGGGVSRGGGRARGEKVFLQTLV